MYHVQHSDAVYGPATCPEYVENKYGTEKLEISAPSSQPKINWEVCSHGCPQSCAQRDRTFHALTKFGSGHPQKGESF